MLRDKFRALTIRGSGFSQEEFNLYDMKHLGKSQDAMNYLSHRANHRIFRPKLNPGFQKYILDDKWVIHHFFSNMGVPVPTTHGLYHPLFGFTSNGELLCSEAHLVNLIQEGGAKKLIFKPRGGSQGRSVTVAELADGHTGEVSVKSNGRLVPFVEFVRKLPAHQQHGYEQGLEGWLVQEYLQQHPFLNELNPHTINTFRIVTFLDKSGAVRIHFSILRLGRAGNAGDNWAQGGLSVFVDPQTGVLGEGVFKPKYGGSWATEHPDTGIRFQGLTVPHWEEILGACRKTALLFPGVRSIGWDVALTPRGPVIVEGNADWDLAMVQVHSKTGYLTGDVRSAFSELGVLFPEKLAPLHKAFMQLAIQRWNQTRGPRVWKQFSDWLGR